MSKNLYIIFADMILILLLFAGCSNKQTTGNSYSRTENEEHLSASTSIQKLTEDSIVDIQLKLTSDLRGKLTT